MGSAVASTVDMYGLADALESATWEAYAADPGHYAGRNAWLFAPTVYGPLAEAEAALAAAIGPDRRTRRELAARNMREPDRRSGEHLAENLRHATLLTARHAALHGVSRERASDRGIGPSCWCGAWSCQAPDLLCGARRDVFGRNIAPGHAAARVILTHSIIAYAGSACVQGFFVDECGAPLRGDYLDGGHPGNGRSILTPEQVAEYMRRHRQGWRIVAGDDAGDALAAAGYRACANPNHPPGWHPFDPGTVRGAGEWSRPTYDDGHTEYGAWQALVVRDDTTTTESEGR